MPSYKGDFLRSFCDFVVQRETIVEPGAMLHKMFMCDIAPECLPLPASSLYFHRFTCQLPYYTRQAKQLASTSYYLALLLTSL
jgi:hypothetical protein